MKSCVSLLSAVCGQPDDVMERWLDLYYQVRHAQEKADAAARAAAMYGISPDKDRFVEASLKASAEKITKRLLEELKIPEIGGPMKASDPTAKDEAADAGRPLSVTAASGGDSSPQWASQESAEDGEAKAEPEPLRENRVKRPGGKGKPRPQAVGNTISHDAADFKRHVRDRLEAVRKKGVSAPELIRTAPTGVALTANNIYEILEGKVLKIEIYRALDEALRHFEN